MVKKKNTTKKRKGNFDISVGSRVMYGRISYIWDDPFVVADKWVFIVNDDPRVYKSYSLYKYTSMNGGELSTTVHFIPPEILSCILELDSADIGLIKKKKDIGGKSKKGK